MEATLLGLTLGLAAGLSPGPLLTLVVQRSLTHGFGAGVRASLAPLVTDAPVIAIAVFTLDRLPPVWLHGLAVAGGLYVLSLGISSIRSPLPDSAEEGEDPARSDPWRDLRQAALVNILSPNPWIFWVGVGGPILVAAWRRSPPDAIGFLSVFLGLLVGLKMVFALLVARGRDALGSRGHRIAVQLTGLLLVALGVGLIYRGVDGVLSGAA